MAERLLRFLRRNDNSIRRAKPVDYAPQIPQYSLENVHSNVANRIVVYGSRGSGAQITAAEFSHYLEEKGVPNISMEWTRFATVIRDGFFGAWNEDMKQPDWVPTLPKGVIVFPEMREDTPYGMHTIPTPEHEIQTLCDEYGVPMVKFSRYESPIEIMNSVVKALKSNSPHELT